MRATWLKSAPYQITFLIMFVSWRSTYFSLDFLKHLSGSFANQFRPAFITKCHLGKKLLTKWCLSLSFWWLECIFFLYTFWIWNIVQSPRQCLLIYTTVFDSFKFLVGWEFVSCHLFSDASVISLCGGSLFVSLTNSFHNRMA